MTARCCAGIKEAGWSQDQHPAPGYRLLLNAKDGAVAPTPEHIQTFMQQCLQVSTPAHAPLLSLQLFLCAIVQHGGALISAKRLLLYALPAAAGKPVFNLGCDNVI